MKQAKNVGSLSGITSTPPCDRVGDKPKLYIPGNKRYAVARFCKYRLLNPAGSGTTGPCPVRFFNEPRAAFYTEKRGKKQNKNVPVCAVVRKFCQASFSINATAIKKGWK
ncbi:hypothetical protein [Klebsiella quasipneumoniae]|uniref:hypothetical protein n=1 Tax=Klebsiella quasipneumoniae TaxID=1463165 RepID=UPI00396C56F1